MNRRPLEAWAYNNCKNLQQMCCPLKKGLAQWFSLPNYHMVLISEQYKGLPNLGRLVKIAMINGGSDWL